MARETGAQYLARITNNYLVMKKTLPKLSGEDFEKLKRGSFFHDLNVGGFLKDFAIAAEERRRDTERWAQGQPLPQLSVKQREIIKGAIPRSVYIDPEALNAITIKPVRTFRIDSVVEDIMAEIALRLPRVLECYYYRQDYAEDAIMVPGLGKLKITMNDTGYGIMKHINVIEHESFYIWLCRQSGVKYLNKYCDTSRPQEIKIKPARIDMTLYDDESGIFVNYRGKRFTNNRVYSSGGVGYMGDSLRNELYRTCFKSDFDKTPGEKYASDNGWEKDETVLSWRKIEDEAIIWLVENVLNPLKEAPLPQQITVMPEEKPFPQDLFPDLYCFASESSIRKILLTQGDPKKVYPHERKAVLPGRRLVALSSHGDFPKEATSGFVWCGVGKIDHDADIDELTIAMSGRNNYTMGDHEGVVAVKPKSVTDVYVVEWQKWDDFREPIFKDHDHMTDKEYNEMWFYIAKSLVPITDYRGDYQKPVVMIGRPLDFDEVKILPNSIKKEVRNG